MGLKTALLLLLVLTALQEVCTTNLTLTLLHEEAQEMVDCRLTMCWGWRTVECGVGVLGAWGGADECVRGLGEGLMSVVWAWGGPRG